MSAERLNGAVAVVTGGSRGIGAAIAAALARADAHVVLVGRSSDTLESVAESCGARARSVVADLGDERAVRDLAAEVSSRHARIDVVVHAAAELAVGPVAEAPTEDFDRQYRVNLRAPYLLTQLLLPGLTAASGDVVFVNSTAGRRAAAGSSQYAATKHGLRAVADALRAEVNDAGVRVITVYPGRTDTPMQAELHRLEGRTYSPERLVGADDVAAAVLSALTAGPRAQVAEIVVLPRKML